jgi:hypothetical protein
LIFLYVFFSLKCLKEIDIICVNSLLEYPYRLCVCVYKSNKSQHIKLGNVILDNEIVIKKVDNQNKKN